MPRPNLSEQRRQELEPVIARAFVELGYRRATTAELAKRCAVRENILYRLWPDKKAMFVASLDHVFERSKQIWEELLAEASGGRTAAELILDYESTHHGEFGLYRIVFAGLSETDDPEIAVALKRLYAHFQRFIREQVTAHRGDRKPGDHPDAALVAWAIVGLGTVANIGRELDLLSTRTRKRLISEIGTSLL